MAAGNNLFVVADQIGRFEALLRWQGVAADIHRHRPLARAEGPIAGAELATLRRAELATRRRPTATLWGTATQPFDWAIKAAIDWSIGGSICWSVKVAPVVGSGEGGRTTPRTVGPVWAIVASPVARSPTSLRRTIIGGSEGSLASRPEWSIATRLEGAEGAITTWAERALATATVGPVGAVGPVGTIGAPLASVVVAAPPRRPSIRHCPLR
jgi:hypothetical protein